MKLNIIPINLIYLMPKFDSTIQKKLYPINFGTSFYTIFCICIFVKIVGFKLNTGILT